ncbi:MAG: sulfurtransferase [Verrucomicrobia bacterium]|nr:sulfurtransferase [Verrucomicrobiota bacterium]
MSAPVLNLSAYKFTPFAEAELPALRDRLRARTAELGLRGTILLATEGINLFVAGPRPATDALIAELRTLPGLADLTPKESQSDERPFNRMLVKIKKEIIAFGQEGIDPARDPAARLEAATLKQWLDEGRPVTLLDTRNDYEIRLGTFKNALVPGIDHFRDFPAAVRRLPTELKAQPIVTFCTGGIRCEKAAPFLAREGFSNVFQLEGGILKYFETCGGAHYEGDCFVFDRRVGVDPQLQETDAVMCFACQMPLTAAEQRDPRYVPDISCPHCAKNPGTGDL